MTQQLCLVLPMPRARRRDPITSHLAAAGARELQAGHASRILAALRDGGPGTIYEIGDRCGLTNVQVARTIAALCKAGATAIVMSDATGDPVVRAAPTGRACRVWRLA